MLKVSKFFNLLFSVYRAALLFVLFIICSLAYANEISLLEQELIRPLYKDNKLNKEKILLGEKLFFDKRLSDDNSISCASCHHFDLGGADAQQFATGIKGQKGQVMLPLCLIVVTILPSSGMDEHSH